MFDIQYPTNCIYILFKMNIYIYAFRYDEHDEICAFRVLWGRCWWEQPGLKWDDIPAWLQSCSLVWIRAVALTSKLRTWQVQKLRKCIQKERERYIYIYIYKPLCKHIEDVLFLLQPSGLGSREEKIQWRIHIDTHGMEKRVHAYFAMMANRGVHVPPPPWIKKVSWKAKKIGIWRSM